MAHNFANAYSNVQNAVDGLIATNVLRDGLNRASTYFSIINDDDFNEIPILRREFRHLRSRLRRNLYHVDGSSIRSLDNTDEPGMNTLSRDIHLFMHKLKSSKIRHAAVQGTERESQIVLIRDPGPDQWWDEDIEGD